MAKIINQTNGLNFLQNEANFIENKLTLTTYNNSTVSIIHSEMFKNCTNLINVSLPNVHTIQDEAFAGCTALTEILLPKGYNIGSSAFNGCTALSLVALFNENNSQPTDSANIGLSAFHGCTALSTLYMGLDTPPVLGGTNPNSVFSQTLLQNTTSTKGNIYVQDGLVATYKASTIWKANNLASKIRVSTYTW